MTQLSLRNHLIFYKASLALDFACEERASYFNPDNNNLDLRGFFNLGVLLMFSNNFMIIIENFLKYGFLIKENVAPV